MSTMDDIIGDNESYDGDSFSSDEVHENVSNSGCDTDSEDEEPGDDELNMDIELEFVKNIKSTTKDRSKNMIMNAIQYNNFWKTDPPQILYEVHAFTCKPFFDFDMKFKRDFVDMDTQPDNVPTMQDVDFLAEDLTKAIQSMFSNEPENYRILVGWREPAWVDKRKPGKKESNWYWKVSLRFWVVGLVTNDNDLNKVIENLQWDISHWPELCREGVTDKGIIQIFDPAVYHPRQKLNVMNTIKDVYDPRKLIPYVIEDDNEIDLLSYVVSYYDKDDEPAQYNAFEASKIQPSDPQVASAFLESVKITQNKKLDTFLNARFNLDTTWKLIEQKSEGKIKYRLEPQDCTCLVDPTYKHDKSQSALILSSRINRNEIGKVKCLGIHGERELKHKEVRGLYVNLRKIIEPHVTKGLFDGRTKNPFLDNGDSGDLGVSEKISDTIPTKNNWNIFERYEQTEEFEEYAIELINQKKGYAYIAKAGTGKTEHMIKMFKYFTDKGLNCLWAAVPNVRSNAQQSIGFNCSTLCELISKYQKPVPEKFYNIVFIDEISLLPTSYLNDLLAMKNTNSSLVFVGCGQFKKQLRPVEPHSINEETYYLNEALMYLFDYNQLTTQKVYRTIDPRLDEFINALENKGLDLSVPIIADVIQLTQEPIGTVIVYSNLLKECINQYMLDTRLLSQSTRGAKLFTNMPVIALDNLKLKNNTWVYNGMLFLVDKFSETEIYLKPQREYFEYYSAYRKFNEKFIDDMTVEELSEYHSKCSILLSKMKDNSRVINYDEFCRYFEPAFAITCHKIQGETMPEHCKVTLTNFEKYKDCMKGDDYSAINYVSSTRNKSLYDLYYLDDKKVKEIEKKYGTKYYNKNWKRQLLNTFKTLKLTDCETFDQFLKDFNPAPYSFQNYGNLWAIDHIVPVSTGNDISNTLKNLQPLTLRENSKKSDKISQ